MKRDLQKLSNKKYDLLIIGGGITGACALWDATLRGLSVALVEKSDFGASTSSASGKLIHGGLRYLQYGALHRVRESLHERMVFLKIAPQFVHLVPFLIPTYGHFIKGKEILTLAMHLYDILSMDKQVKDTGKVIPPHKVLSKKEVLTLCPGLETKKLTGAISYTECQMHNSERLTLSFLTAASSTGADLANYLKVRNFNITGDRVTGVKVQDVFTGDAFDIQARVILNASGPWTNKILNPLKKSSSQIRGRLSKGIHIVTRAITKEYAVALTTKHTHSGALLQRGGRHFFIVPWRNYSLIGTTNVPFKGDLDDKMVTERDIQNFLEEINEVYPSMILKKKDVVYAYGGLYPDDIKKGFEKGYQGGRKDQIFDHQKSDGIEGIISAICVKYTTARKLSQKCIDLVFKKLGKKSPECLTEKLPISGGKIENFNNFLTYQIKKKSSKVDKETIKHLVYNYGADSSTVLNYVNNDPFWNETVSLNSPIIKSQILYGIREEMACKLTDVVFRRTGLGTTGNPGKIALGTCASIMAKELGWNEKRTEMEMADVKDFYSVI